MTTTEGFFDFLRGDKTISVTENVNSKKEEPVGVKKNEKWILYTINPESINCPLDCLIVHVRYLSVLYLSYTLLFLLELLYIRQK